MADCDRVLDRLSRMASRGFRSPLSPDLSEHLERCAACAREWEFFLRLSMARPIPPKGLREEILDRLGRDSDSATRWWAGVSAAAAVLLLALSASLVSHTVTPRNGADSLAFFLDIDVADDRAEEWFVAGAPVFEGLPDHTLLALLEEEP